MAHRLPNNIARGINYREKDHLKLIPKRGFKYNSYEVIRNICKSYAIKMLL